METLPEKAGEAILNFKPDRKRSFRRRERIYLPADPAAQFFPLQEGRQFLFIGRQNRNIYFGGTDEQPFLTQMVDSLTHSQLLNHISGGIYPEYEMDEQEFYNALKPEVISYLEQRHDVQTKRQGDIFAVKIPHTMQEIVRANAVLGSDEKPTQGEWSVFDTRHTLNGSRFHTTLFDDDNGLWDGVVAQGTMTAPNHKPINLNGLHVLAQTQYLANPGNDD